MFKFITAIVAAALVAGFIVFLTSTTPVANSSEIQHALPNSLTKASHLPVMSKGTACSQRGWPYYEPSCLFDERLPVGEYQKIRIIALDLLKPLDPARAITVLAER